MANYNLDDEDELASKEPIVSKEIDPYLTKNSSSLDDEDQALIEKINQQAKDQANPSDSSDEEVDQEEPSNIGKIQKLLKPTTPVSTNPTLPVDSKSGPAPKPASSNVDDELKAAIEDRNRKQMVAGLMEAGAQIGAGIGRTQYNPGQISKHLQEAANQPVQDIALKQEMKSKQVDLDLKKQENDPNSPIAKVYIDAFQKVFKKPAPVGLTPAQFKAAGFNLDTVLNKQMQLEMVKAQREQNLLLKQQMLNDKKEKDYDKAYSDAGKQIEQAKSRGVVKNAYEVDRLVENANSLLSEYPDLNKMPQSQVRLFASEMGKIAKGGVAGEHDTNAIMNKTVASSLTNALSNLINEPTGARLGAFLNEYKPYLQSIQQNSRKVIGENVSNIIETNKRKLRPEDYDTMKNMSNYKKYTDVASPQNETPNKPVSGPIQPQTDNMIKIITPDGRKMRIPADKLDEAKKLGAQIAG